MHLPTASITSKPSDKAAWLSAALTGNAPLSAPALYGQGGPWKVCCTCLRYYSDTILETHGVYILLKVCLSLWLDYHGPKGVLLCPPILHREDAWDSKDNQIRHFLWAHISHPDQCSWETRTLRGAAYSFCEQLPSLLLTCNFQNNSPEQEGQPCPM